MMDVHGGRSTCFLDQISVELSLIPEKVTEFHILSTPIYPISKRRCVKSKNFKINDRDDAGSYNFNFTMTGPSKQRTLSDGLIHENI